MAFDRCGSIRSCRWARGSIDDWQRSSKEAETQIAAVKKEAKVIRSGAVASLRGLILLVVVASSALCGVAGVDFCARYMDRSLVRS